MGGPRRSLRCASASAKEKLRSSTRALSAPSTHTLRLEAVARSSSRSSRPKQAVSSPQNRRSRSQGKAGRSKTPARPRPLPDHTQLDLPIRTPEQRRRYWNGLREYLYNSDPVLRRMGEKVSRGLEVEQIVEEEIESRNRSLHATMALLQKSVAPVANDGILSRPQSPVVQDIGDAVPQFDEIDGSVQDNQDRVVPANDSHPESPILLDNGGPAPEWRHNVDVVYNQDRDVPANRSRTHSPVGIDIGPPTDEWRHIDDLEDDQDWEVAENLSLPASLIAENFKRSPTPTSQFGPIYGFSGRIEYPSRATISQQVPEHAHQDSSVVFPPKTEISEHKGRRKQVLVEQDVLGRDVIKTKPLEPNLLKKPIKVEEPSPDDSISSSTPVPSEIIDAPHAIKTEPNAPSSSPVPARLSTPPFTIPTKAERQAARRGPPKQTAMAPNPRICVTGRPDFPPPRSIDTVTGAITHDWVKSESPDSVTAPVVKKPATRGTGAGRKTKTGVPKGINGPFKKVSVRVSMPIFRRDRVNKATLAGSPRPSSQFPRSPSPGLPGLSSHRPSSPILGPSPPRPSSPIPGPSSLRPSSPIPGPSSPRPSSPIPGPSSPRPSSPIPGPSFLGPMRSSPRRIQFENDRKAWFAKLGKLKPGSRKFLEIFTDGEEKYIPKWNKNIWSSGRNYRKHIGKFDEPHLFETKDGLHLEIPNLKFEDLKIFLKPEHKITVIFGGETANEEWTSKEFLKKFAEWDESQGTLNSLSLEVTKSHPELSEQIIVPEFVREHSMVDKLEGILKKKIEELGAAPSKQRLVNALKKRLDFLPQLQKYLILSTKGSFTDIHIDFSASSVYYHVVVGKKIFYFCRPTKENLEAYKKMELSKDVGSWLGSEDMGWHRVEICAGQTAMIPSGWLHFVFTPMKSMVVGGNFLMAEYLESQFDITKLEEQRTVNEPSYADMMYQGFLDVMWFFVELSLIPDLRQALATGADVTELKDMGRIFLRELTPARRGVWNKTKQNKIIYKRLKALMKKSSAGPSSAPSTSQQQRVPRKRVAPPATGEPKRKSSRIAKK